MQMKYISYSAFAEYFAALMAEGRAAHLEGDCILAPADNGQMEIYRLPVILRQEGLNSLDLIQQALESPSYYAIILLQAGRASLAVGKADEIICSKQIQKYMVRKSQGKAQLSYLNQKGKSRLGSRIRLRQSVEFFREVNDKLSDWKQQFALERLYLSCSPKLKGFWFQSSSTPPFAKKDSRWQRIPFMVKLPSQAELLRIQRLICQFSLLSAEEFQISAASPQSSFKS